jgi:hypothetical protein
MRPVRIRYGGQTFYVHDGGGRFFETVEDDWETGSGALTQSFRTLDTASGAVTGSILYVVLIQPYGQPISKAYFNRGTGRGSRLADPRELVDICNRAGAHCWLHIPPFASDDLIDRFAVAVRDRLAPGIEAWFELGNELWNNYRRTFPWPAHFQHLADVSGHDFSGWPARQLLGHFIGNMARRVRAVFEGSGKTCRLVINCQLGAGTMEENDLYCSGLGGYAPGDAPGDLVDYLAWAPYSCHPAYHDGDGTTEDGAFYVRALAAFRAGNKAAAFSIMRDMRTHHLLEGYYGRIFGDGPHERLRRKWNKLNVMYEGGFHHFASSGAYRSVQQANGFTDYEARNLFWQYRRSDEYAEVVRAVFGKWLSDPTKLYPSHYVLIDSWQTEASFALGNWNSPFAASDIAPPFSAFRELNTPA